MRIAIVVIVVIALAFAVYLAAAGSGALQFKGFRGPPQNADGTPDLDNWSPPDIMAKFSNLTLNFAPHADLGPSPQTASYGQSLSLTAAPASKLQMAKLTLSGPGGVRVVYDCASSDSDQCPVTLCLCTPGSGLVPAAVAACPAAFRQHVGGSGVCDSQSPATGTLPIYPDARQLEARALGVQGAIVKLK